MVDVLLLHGNILLLGVKIDIKLFKSLLVICELGFKFLLILLFDTMKPHLFLFSCEVLRF